jgi:hypothetical protein
MSSDKHGLDVHIFVAQSIEIGCDTAPLKTARERCFKAPQLEIMARGR